LPEGYIHISYHTIYIGLPALKQRKRNAMELLFGRCRHASIRETLPVIVESCVFSQPRLTQNRIGMPSCKYNYRTLSYGSASHGFTLARRELAHCYHRNINHRYYITRSLIATVKLQRILTRAAPSQRDRATPRVT